MPQLILKSHLTLGLRLWVRFILKLCFVLSLLLVTNSPFKLFANVLTAAPEQTPIYRFNRYANEQGLKNTGVLQVLQGHHGYIWVATQDGLYRFDGFKFKAFKHQPNNDNSLANNYIQTLFVDSNEQLWVGTWGGVLHQYVAEHEQFNRYPFHPDYPNSTVSTKAITAISEDSHQQLWVATFGAGVRLFDKSKKRFTSAFDTNNGLSDNKIYSVLVDNQGLNNQELVWIGTRDGGLNRLNPKTSDIRHYQHNSNDPNSLSHNRVYSLLQGSDGYLWLGTRGGGLNRFDKQTERFVAYRHNPQNPNSLSSDLVYSLFEDSSAQLWIGTRGGGLNRFNSATQSFMRFEANDKDDYSISYNNVYSISQDNNGLIWLGTMGGGLNSFDPSHSRFGLVRHQKSRKAGLNQGIIRAITVDANGDIWFGTSQGLNRYNLATGEYRLYQQNPNDSNSLSSNNIISLLATKDGNLWVGTAPGGLNRLDINSGLFYHYKHDPNDPTSISDNRVSVLHQDPQGQLWVGTTNGLNRFNSQTGTFIRFQHIANNPETISDDSISALHSALDGSLWVGTWSGLNHFDYKSKRFLRYRSNPADVDNSLSHNEIYSIYQDKQGIFWLGIGGGGLNRFDVELKQFKHYRTEHGLSGDIVRGIVADSRGYLWLGLTNSISRFDSKNETFINDIGLQAGCTGIADGSFFKANDGKLYFGGSDGYCAFYPDKAIQAVNTAKVVLTDFKLLNKSVPISPKLNANAMLTEAVNFTPNITLSYEDNILSFEFVALDFVDPNVNKYKYQLAGFSPHWIATGADNRRATYTNLPAGDYIFKVKATNHKGEWGEAKSIGLTVLPAPWRTWWAKSIYVLSFMALIMALIGQQQQKVRHQKQRVLAEQKVNQQLQELDKLKDEFLANTSHELRTPLNGIIGLAESLLDGVAGPLPNKAQQNLSMVVSSSRRLANLVNDILDFSTLKNAHLALTLNPVDLHSVTEVVLTLLQPLVGSKEIKLVNDIDKDLVAVYADENRVQQILNNLVGNGIKFTEKGEIRVSAELIPVDEQRDGPQMVSICVSDSGIGIEPSKFDSIFASFEQVQSDVAGSQSGTGLGLSVSKQLVELHGGEISVDSALGEGARFWFTLPVSDKSASPIANKLVATMTQALNPLQTVDEGVEPIYTQPHLTSDNLRFKILLVDDEPINRQVLLNHLALRDYQLVEAGSGEQALEIIEQDGPFDLVLLDIMMPKVSGYEVCRRLRELYPASDLPVIFLTAKNLLADLVKSFNAGGNDYLNKPINKPELLARVENHLNLLDIHRHLELKVGERTESLRQANEQLRTISNIGLQLNQSLDLHKVMRAIFESVSTLMDVGRFGIGLYQPDSERLDVEFTFEQGKPYRPFNRDMNDGSQFAVWCIKQCETIFINDLAEEGEKYIKNHEFMRKHLNFALDDGSTTKMRPPQSLMYVPLLLQQQVVGFFTVQSFASHAYEQQDLDVLTTLAHYMATAIDNAKMHQQLIENKNELTKQQLADADKMAALGTLTVGIAHEINNPTNFVRVSVHNLENSLNQFQDFILQLAADADEQTKQVISDQFSPLHQHLETITNGTKRITTIVQDLRTFTHTKQGETVEADIRQNLRATVSLVRAQYKEQVEITIDDNEIPLINCVQGELNQVFMNLIVNGIDAIGEKQQENPDNQDLGEIHISCKASDNHVEVSIADSGNGMSEETKSRLFDPFYTTKPIGKGTGLGLSISFGIIQKHGGEIKVESQLGKGSIFTVVLPIDAENSD